MNDSLLKQKGIQLILKNSDFLNKSILKKKLVLQLLPSYTKYG